MTIRVLAILSVAIVAISVGVSSNFVGSSAVRLRSPAGAQTQTIAAEPLLVERVGSHKDANLGEVSVPAPRNIPIWIDPAHTPATIATQKKEPSSSPMLDEGSTAEPSKMNPPSPRRQPGHVMSAPTVSNPHHAASRLNRNCTASHSGDFGCSKAGKSTLSARSDPFGGKPAPASGQRLARRPDRIVANRSSSTPFNLLVHGNYCGLGNNAPLAPIDALDAACARHDACTPMNGLPTRACNLRLQREAEAIAVNPRQPQEVRTAAGAVAVFAAATPSRDYPDVVPERALESVAYIISAGLR